MPRDFDDVSAVELKAIKGSARRGGALKVDSSGSLGVSAKSNISEVDLDPNVGRRSVAESSTAQDEIAGSYKENEDTLVQPHDDKEILYIFAPTWRSQLLHLIGFFVISSITIAITRYYPGFCLLPGKLFRLGDSTYVLYFPWLFLIPGFLLARIFLRIFDSRFIVDDRGIEAQIGLLSMSLRQPRLRYEDIRGVEPKQTIFERVLGIGSLLVGSSMTFDVEISMQGIADPRGVQRLINLERDKYLKRMRGDGKTTFLKATVE